MRVELVVLAVIAAAGLLLGWWLTSPRFIGFLVARRLRRLKAVARSLSPMLNEETDPMANVVVINRAESTPVPAQRSAELPPPDHIDTLTQPIVN
ncbi:hypothetical protein [Kutzneria sp. NPDC052558]|uniref:hypothetical protein n=1 Tax=Kutzneria sp. NPDC052558 TaxID=3364121 RepID=UPI0037C931D2